MMFGGMLGAHLAGPDRRPEPSGLSRRLIVAGMALLALYHYADRLKAAGYGSVHFWASNPDLMLLRLETVTLLIVSPRLDLDQSPRRSANAADGGPSDSADLPAAFDDPV
jgi:hypothetical protein